MEDRPDVDALVAELRARVEQRRQSGVYPPGLEDELDQHFRRIAAHRTIPDSQSLVNALNPGTDNPVYVTGHSKGGGVASLLAYILSQNMNIPVQPLVTFASPKPLTVST